MSAEREKTRKNASALGHLPYLGNLNYPNLTWWVLYTWTVENRMYSLAIGPGGEVATKDAHRRILDLIGTRLRLLA